MFLVRLIFFLIITIYHINFKKKPKSGDDDENASISKNFRFFKIIHLTLLFSSLGLNVFLIGRLLDIHEAVIERCPELTSKIQTILEKEPCSIELEHLEDTLDDIPGIKIDPAPLEKNSND